MKHVRRGSKDIVGGLVKTEFEYPELKHVRRGSKDIVGGLVKTEFEYPELKPCKSIKMDQVSC